MLASEAGTIEKPAKRRNAPIPPGASVDADVGAHHRESPNEPADLYV